MMDQPRKRETLPKSVRIRSRQDFNRIFQDRIRASDERITLYAGRNDLPFARLGIATPRRLGKAVERNRIKRLVREAFRRVRHDLPPGTDWIVLPRKEARLDVDRLQESILRLSRRLQKRLQPDRPAPENNRGN